MFVTPLWGASPHVVTPVMGLTDCPGDEYPGLDAKGIRVGLVGRPCMPLQLCGLSHVDTPVVELYQ